MSNWTSNIIRVEGPEAAMREFLNHFKGDDEPFDFNRIIPMPAILRHTGSGARTFDGRTHRSNLPSNSAGPTRIKTTSRTACASASANPQNKGGDHEANTHPLRPLRRSAPGLDHVPLQH
jgi:hypothetical protein